jgi:hypothetical protein
VVEAVVLDTSKPEPDREPDRPELSEQEIREYTRRLRALPVDQVIAEALFALLNAAEVKLGRRDARLLIDVVAVSLGHARDHLSAELVARVDDLLGQLRFAQVAAEGRVGQPGHAKEDNDLDRVPTPPTATPAARASHETPSSSGRLWVPGR